LERLAIVYVRQSTPHQVFENQESRARQYALVDHATTLGWPRERILVIDEDQGHSGQSMEGRTGFKRLLAEVTLDHVGIVLGLEMSRLARSNKDWHHLLELCAIFGTLLADQDGIYDPQDANDRLLLGLKGTMSELEIHTMRNRLQKGKLHKAQRGALFTEVPIGYVRTSSEELALDPDEQVRSVVKLIFDKFDELGSLYAVLRYLFQHNIRLGIRARCGPHLGQLEWRRPCYPTLWGMLHHPFYAGTYAYGRSCTDPKRKQPGRRGTGRKMVSMDQWKVVLHDRLPAYITYERYLLNQERLHQNRARFDAPGVPRHGTALLTGLVYCGNCGTRVRVRYPRSARPRYDCNRHLRLGLERNCHSLETAVIDDLVSQQVLQAVQPAALELSLRACEDVQRERDRLTLYWQQQLQRARYETAQAERHYRAVDPENRLVAGTLEKEWEQALHKERQVQEDHERFLRQVPARLTPEEQERVRVLANDIPALWNASTTTLADRKEIIRCLLTRVFVTVQKDNEYVDLTLHWAGGFTSQHQVVRPIKEYDRLSDYTRLVDRARQLRESGHTAAEIAEKLNTEGFHSIKGESKFSTGQMRQLLVRWGLCGVRDQEVVLNSHEWLLPDLSRKLGVGSSKLRRWIRRGWVHCRQTPIMRLHIIWANRKELDRLCRLRDHAKAHPYQPYPEAITAPGPRSPDQR
jgi:DNA invertase Pin-like site-specific DNA recombinase